MKRVGVIGLGKMGLLHASLLNTMPDVKLTAFCEKSSLIRRFTKKMMADITMVAGVDELSGFDLDAVYVTTPPSSHHAIVSTLFVQSICRNIFVEKPLASSVTESRYLEGLPTALGVESINMVGYNRRFSVTFRKAKEIIEEGTLGEPTSFEAHALSSDFQAGGHGRPNGRGGVVKDLASHAIDLAIWMVGDVSVESIASSQVASSGAVDSVSFHVDGRSGLRGLIRASWIEADYRLPEIGFVIEGDSGRTLVVNEDVLELRSDGGDKEVWHRHDLNDAADFLLGGTEYLREDRLFIDSIEIGRAVEPNFSTALRVDEIVHDVEVRIGGRQ